jgi:uncharacterized 2Fe-2S/4Fe-4S cluster protein (DUF4445 family)
MPYTISIESHKKTLLGNRGELLADVIQKAGIHLSVYCDRKGLCGKCFVEIIEGKIPAPSEHEQYLIDQKEHPPNYRLACIHRIKGNMRIKVPEESILKEAVVLTTGLRSSVPVHPAVKKIHLLLRRPEIASPFSLMEILERHLKQKRLLAPARLMRNMNRILEKNNYDVTLVTYKDKELLDIEPQNRQALAYGLAIDIGTTTLVLELLNLITGETMGILTSLNSQSIRGSDVVSRISYAFKDKKRLNKLRDQIREDINSMIEELLKKTKIDPANVYDIVVAGNTAMNHFFLGLPVDTLALAPYNSVFSCLAEISSRELGFHVNTNAKVYVAPNIKSFVGGDISAGLTASDLAHKKGVYLFIDLGTNGEIVLKTEKNIIATSTAAGPAFEGMKISCGMLALPGAIYKAKFADRLRTYTLGKMPARGICGTGLIDLIAIFLEQGKLSPSGKIQNKIKKIIVKDKIFISQNDIREMQLACAAIKTGIKMMLEEHHLTKDQLDGIYIAGAFGNYLNIKNSMKIGLLPPIDEDKIIFIGNASLAGAKNLLVSAESRKNVENLVRKIRFVSLASRPSFQQIFLEALAFGSSL